MKDFEHKKIKITLNSNSGWLAVTGAYLKEEDNFLVFYNPMIQKIQYLSMFYIKSVEILGDYKEGEQNEE